MGGAVKTIDIGRAPFVDEKLFGKRVKGVFGIPA
tara:strand:+ start:5272 stop:5373 length:102 start_codon:yes stop_codon:yes gene_type:complete